MNENSNLNLSLSISIGAHIALIIAILTVGIFPQKKTVISAEIHYVKQPLKSVITVKKHLEKASAGDLEKIGLKQKIILSAENKIPENKFQAGKSFEEYDFFARNKEVIEKPRPAKIELVARNDMKFLLSDSSAKYQSTVYLNYRNFLHETLRRFLYNKYSEGTEKGEVYLTFILRADGSIKEARVVDEKSTAGFELKKVVLSSLYEASPFPPLPESLNSSVLTFSVAINFTEE